MLVQAAAKRMSASADDPSPPIFLSFAAHRLARGVLRLQPHLRRPAAIGSIRPLRHDALQPHAADVVEHDRALLGQMLDESDGVLGPADQSGEPPLAFDQPA